MRVAMIGWRGWTTETEEGTLATVMGKQIVRQGDEIITGNAPGFDQAVALGGNSINPGKVHLHLPWAGFERHATVSGNKIYNQPSDATMDYTASLWGSYKDNWFSLRPAVQKLMARNVDIIMQSVRVIAAPKPGGGGGTAFGIWLAEYFKKPCFVIDFADKHRPPWDVCSRCGFQTSAFDCGAPIHSMKGYL